MLFWIIPILIALAVALLLARSLRATPEVGQSAAASDIAVYRDQLKEIDRDLARGVLTEAEAEAVRTEVSRRLLEADKRASEAQAETASNQGPIAAAMVFALLAASFLLYAWIGAPGLTDLPMKSRLADIDAAAQSRMSQLEAEERARPNLPQAPEADPAFLDLMVKLREALESRPDDIQGLTLLAENEARLGNYTASREAQERLVAAYGADAPIGEKIQLVDLMVFTAGGFVSPEAESVLNQILQAAPSNGSARYYAGLLQAQNGRPDRAFPIWRRLLEESTPDAPWLPVIRAEIANVAAEAGIDYTPPPLRGPTQEDVEAASDMSEEDRRAMIEGMVEGLADRLATDGGPPEDWARLITALGVMGQTDRARAISDEALQVFADSPAALMIINTARAGAGLTE